MGKAEYVTFTPRNLVLPRARFLTQTEQTAYENTVKETYET